MSKVGQRERLVQDRIVKFLQEKLNYEYLGNWEKQSSFNLLKDQFLKFQIAHGIDESMASRAFAELDKLANYGSGNLYQRNKDFYRALRYGIKLAPELGKQKETIWPIDWKNFEKNHFAFAEEVTVEGKIANKRPDIVIYINGIAIAVIEFKRSTVSIEEGILQHLDNQKEEFIENFFSTVQILIAGNDTQGVKYGTVGTERNGYYYWNEEDKEIENKLERALKQILSKERVLPIVKSFISFANGTKIICRSNQFHGVNALVEAAKSDENGMIWHTQGSGKSMTMVWGGKAIRENIDNSRILILTDREQLDEQIEGIFLGVDEKISRAKSGADLIQLLGDSSESLVCSLIHKFGKSKKSEEEMSEEELKAYVEDLKNNIISNFKPAGKIFIFIDEAHRTQAGALHKYMKELIPDAVIYGFTGTPIFKNAKTLSSRIFGRIIHSYKYDEAVRDEVVTDIAYEARDVDKVISDQSKIDAYFDAKTKNLNDIAKTDLKKKWASKQEVESAKQRLQIIVDDINLDMLTKPRLMSNRGNALLVANSIEEGCRYFDLLNSDSSGLKGKVGLVTSYIPSANDLKGVGNSAEKYKTYVKMIAEELRCKEEEAPNKCDEYITQVKNKFLKEPGQMKLLVVVDMLLTGFDAPSATYLYIDKPMKDHALFQAVCRVNRIDPTGDDKNRGFIIDYRSLFGVLKDSVIDYTKGGFENYDAEDIAGILKPIGPENRTELDDMIQATSRLLEPIKNIEKTEDVLKHFVGDTSNLDEFADFERLRTDYYKQVNSTVRTYSALSGREEEAGYSEDEFKAVKQKIEHFVKIKDEISVASGDYIDIALYEKDMRILIDTYIKSNRSKVVADLNNRPLLDILATEGEKVLGNLPEGIAKNRTAVAETITNNIRRTIVEKSATNPKYFEKLSKQLEEVIKEMAKDAKEYEEFLRKLIALGNEVVNPTHDYPKEIAALGEGAGAIYDQTEGNIEISIKANQIFMDAQEGWRTNPLKTRQVRNSLIEALKDADLVEKILEVAKHHENY